MTGSQSQYIYLEPFTRLLADMPTKTDKVLSRDPVVGVREPALLGQGAALSANMFAKYLTQS